MLDFESDLGSSRALLLSLDGTPPEKIGSFKLEDHNVEEWSEGRKHRARKEVGKWTDPERQADLQYKKEEEKLGEGGNSRTELIAGTAPGSKFQIVRSFKTSGDQGTGQVTTSTTSYQMSSSRGGRATSKTTSNKTSTTKTFSRGLPSARDDDFDQLRMTFQPLDTSTQREKINVGRSGAMGIRRPPSRKLNRVMSPTIEDHPTGDEEEGVEPVSEIPHEDPHISILEFKDISPKIRVGFPVEIQLELQTKLNPSANGQSHFHNQRERTFESKPSPQTEFRSAADNGFRKSTIFNDSYWQDSSRSPSPTPDIFDLMPSKTEERFRNCTYEIPISLPNDDDPSDVEEYNQGGSYVALNFNLPDFSARIHTSRKTEEESLLDHNLGSFKRGEGDGSDLREFPSFGEKKSEPKPQWSFFGEANEKEYKEPLPRRYSSPSPLNGNEQSYESNREDRRNSSDTHNFFRVLDQTPDLLKKMNFADIFPAGNYFSRVAESADLDYRQQKAAETKDATDWTLRSPSPWDNEATEENDEEVTVYDYRREAPKPVKKVEFSKTEIHFDQDNPPVLVETDENKPSTSHLFRKRVRGKKTQSEEAQERFRRETLEALNSPSTIPESEQTEEISEDVSEEKPSDSPPEKIPQIPEFNIRKYPGTSYEGELKIQKFLKQLKSPIWDFEENTTQPQEQYNSRFENGSFVPQATRNSLIEMNNNSRDFATADAASSANYSLPHSHSTPEGNKTHEKSLSPSLTPKAWKTPPPLPPKKRNNLRYSWDGDSSLYAPQRGDLEESGPTSLDKGIQAPSPDIIQMSRKTPPPPPPKKKTPKNSPDEGQCRKDMESVDLVSSREERNREILYNQDQKRRTPSREESVERAVPEWVHKAKIRESRKMDWSAIGRRQGHNIVSEDGSGREPPWIREFRVKTKTGSGGQTPLASEEKSPILMPPAIYPWTEEKSKPPSRDNITQEAGETVSKMTLQQELPVIREKSRPLPPPPPPPPKTKKKPVTVDKKEKPENITPISDETNPEIIVSTNNKKRHEKEPASVVAGDENSMYAFSGQVQGQGRPERVGRSKESRRKWGQPGDNPPQPLSLQGISSKAAPKPPKPPQRVGSLEAERKREARNLRKATEPSQSSEVPQTSAPNIIRHPTIKISKLPIRSTVRVNASSPTEFRYSSSTSSSRSKAKPVSLMSKCRTKFDELKGNGSSAVSQQNQSSFTSGKKGGGRVSSTVTTTFGFTGTGRGDRR